MNMQIDAIIIGAQKAGTTSLNRYLSQHPNIYTHFTQEFGMFGNIETYHQGFKHFYDNSVSDSVKNNLLKNTFVAKRVGVMYKPELLIKLKEHNPDVKIIILLRNPIDRAFSAFWYCRNNGMEPYDKFEDAIYINNASRFKNSSFEKDCDYLERSNYLNHLKNIFKTFPPENIKLFLFEQMVTDLNKYLNEVCTFLNLPEYQFDISIKYNEGKEPRFAFLAQLVSPRKNTLLKNFIPLKQRIKLRKVLKRINAKRAKIHVKKNMDTATRNYLKQHFSKSVNELQSFTNLPLKKYWKEFFFL